MKTRFSRTILTILHLAICFHTTIIAQPLVCTIDTTWPTDGFEITQKFKGKNVHEGVDIDLEIGDNVYAFAYGVVDYVFPGIKIDVDGDGIIDRVDPHPVAGWYIHIDHGGGVVTRYLHLSRILVEKDQKVTKGQPIGLGGNTGHVIPAPGKDGSHLHFEIWVGTVPENPEWWLLQWTKKLEPETNKYSVNLGISTVVSLVIARDPNAKYGPQGYVTAGQTLNYTVEFENEGEGIA